MHLVRIATPAGEIEIETGRIARQANGSALVRMGDTVLLATAVAAASARPGAGFFPLTVEYREKMSAAGRIPGSYLRREGRISDHEVITCRITDRTIRPLFPSGFLADTQVLLNVFSADREIEPASLAVLAASAALQLSDIPWDGPVSGTRIAHGKEGWVVFPTRAQRKVADLDLVVSSGRGGLIMVEGEGREVPEERVLQALSRADEMNREIISGIERLAQEAGAAKRNFVSVSRDLALEASVKQRASGELAQVITVPGKKERAEALASLRHQVVDELAAAYPEAGEELPGAFSRLAKSAIRGRIDREGLRLDGRGPEDVRDIWGEVTWLPRSHGSAIFTRGETQALVSCTLGSSSDEQRYETIEGNEIERFMLHYNFPPYSVGETRPLRGPGRREIGHGTLAHRALSAVMPPFEDFSYTIRLLSEISESNGSSSMATVCGGCLALMDAGVPLVRPVAGIAMGLIREEDRYTVLSDILGDEDHLGDMDFKVTGSREGITAIQMDNKLGTVPSEVLEKALAQARQGRLHILDEMDKVLPAPREQVAGHAPRIVSLRIRPERIRDIIGQGGRTIQGLQARTSTRIDINDQGLVRIYAKDAEGAREARRSVEKLAFEPEVGQVYRGKVVLIRDFFAVVALGGSVEGKVHVSELEEGRTERVQDVLKKDDEVVVRVLGVDKQGRIVLSRRAALGADPLF